MPVSMPLALAKLSSAEYLDLDVQCKAKHKIIGVMRAGVCMDVAVFLNLDAAEEFLALGVWPRADAVAEMPEQFVIGDAFDGQVWEKQALPAAAEEESL